MKNSYSIKDTSSASVLDVDTNSRRVKVVISEMGSKDLDNDVIESGAFTKTIMERGPKGANLIWHLTDHYPTMKNAVGKPSEIYVDGSKLVMVTDIPATTWGNDVLELYKTGNINQHSIGFRIIKAEPVDAGTPNEYRAIKEVLLYEGSAVLWGANPNTPTLSVGKSMTKAEADTMIEQITGNLEKMVKAMKSGNLTDDTFELIEMRIQQENEKIKQLYNAIQPAVQAVEPVKGIADDLYYLTLKHF